MKRTILNFVGIVALIAGLLSVAMTVRDVVAAIYFGVLGHGYLRPYDYIADLGDVIVAIVSLGIGLFLMHDHFQRDRPRMILSVATFLAVVLGLIATRAYF